MKSQLRHLGVDALYPTKSYNLPSVWERHGLDPSTDFRHGKGRHANGTQLKLSP
jgi:hypothetical protein